ncbi:MAG: DUF1549 domain-containing protein [Bryobacteraceae bacterium]
MFKQLRPFVAFLLTASLLLSAASVAPLGKYTATERKHWAFQPRSNPALPAYTQAAEMAWAKSPIDAFVLARMKKVDLHPAPKADRGTLIRRLSFDLTGLPPAPADVQAFVSDKSPSAGKVG